MNAFQKIDGLVNTSVLEEFERATKALWRDIQFGDKKFSPVEAITFMSRKMGLFTREADQDGPLTLDQAPMVRAAIEFVKTHAHTRAQFVVAKETATCLYDLDAEGIRLMKDVLSRRAS